MPFNDGYIARMFLEAIDEPQPEEALNKEPPPPSQQQVDQQMHAEKMKLETAKFEEDKKRRKFDPVLALGKAMEAFAKAKSISNEGEMAQMEQALTMMVERMKQETEGHKIMAAAGTQQVEMTDRHEQRKHDAAKQATNPNSGGA